MNPDRPVEDDQAGRQSKRETGSGFHGAAPDIIQCRAERETSDISALGGQPHQCPSQTSRLWRQILDLLLNNNIVPGRGLGPWNNINIDRPSLALSAASRNLNDIISTPVCEEKETVRICWCLSCGL